MDGFICMIKSMSVSEQESSRKPLSPTAIGFVVIVYLGATLGHVDLPNLAFSIVRGRSMKLLARSAEASYSSSVAIVVNSATGQRGQRAAHAAQQLSARADLRVLNLSAIAATFEGHCELL